MMYMVYICCAGGLTSSLFCSKISKATTPDDKLYFDDIESLGKKFKKGELDKYDIVLGYGPTSIINENLLKNTIFTEMVDLVFIAPQARYFFNKVNELLKPYAISCNTIDRKTFGQMDGEQGLAMIKQLLSEKNKI